MVNLRDVVVCGYQEVQAFVAACRSALAAVGVQQMDEDEELKQLKSAVVLRVEELEKETKSSAPITSLLSDKRNVCPVFIMWWILYGVAHSTGLGSSLSAS